MTRAATVATSATPPRPATGLGALVRHAVFVVSGNPVTGLSLALFVLLLLIAVLSTDSFRAMALNYVAKKT